MTATRTRMSGLAKATEKGSLGFRVDKRQLAGGSKRSHFVCDLETEYAIGRNAVGNSFPDSR